MDLAAFGDLSEDQDKYKYNYTKQGYKKMLNMRHESTKEKGGNTNIEVYDGAV